MMQHLPINGFKWTDQEFTTEDILNMADDAAKGYMFEVDLLYPDRLHDLHNDYPFCAKNMPVPKPFGERPSKQEKLLLTLFDKKNYVIHYRMLKLALQHGLILQKIHRTLEFNQSPWLKSYIMLNTEMRTKANNEFEKNLYKLLNNAIFGKCMENVRARVDIQLKTTWDGRYGARKLVAQPNFKRRIIFNEDLIAVEMGRTNILMNKPVSIGMAILDISKVVMYEFYYNFLKVKYGENICLAYTDTDSFVLHIKTDDFYADMKEDLERYDTSDYPLGNKFQIPQVNKKVPGLFKDEMNSKIISSFVGLRSKMYSIRIDGEANAQKSEIKKAKGVKEYVVKKELTFDDYLNCLKNNIEIEKSQNTFRSKLHKVYTIQTTKKALSPFDEKRQILPGNIETLAHGHYRLRSFE